MGQEPLPPALGTGAPGVAGLAGRLRLELVAGPGGPGRTVGPAGGLAGATRRQGGSSPGRLPAGVAVPGGAAGRQPLVPGLRSPGTAGQPAGGGVVHALHVPACHIPGCHMERTSTDRQVTPSSQESTPARRTSLAEMVEHWVGRLFDQLGEHHVPRLYRRVIEQVERVLIEQALLRSGGRQQQAARMLGLHRNSLRYRMRVLGISSRRDRERRP
ncbi:MAG: hypothetical protein DRI34_11815 [Deltaproteobacteria bacterium]|nr:MAG: hypothetical protein DRI34_11815 [Deltaproteobacteria bacterium]